MSTNASIGNLFLAGVMPGLVLSGLPAAVTLVIARVIARRRGCPRTPRARWMERLLGAL